MSLSDLEKRAQSIRSNDFFYQNGDTVRVKGGALQ